MIRILVKFYFDREIRAVGFVMFLFCWVIGIFFEILSGNENHTLTIILLSAVIGATFFSTHYGISINKKEKWILRSLNVLGIRFGKKQFYENIDFCIILKGSYSDIHMLGPFGIPSNGDKFNAFLQLSNGEMVEIGSSKDRLKLLKMINNFRFQLELDIHQYDDENDSVDPIHTKIFSSNVKAKRGKDLIILSGVCLFFAFLSILDNLLQGWISYWSVLFLILSLTALSIGFSWLWREKRKSQKSIQHSDSPEK